PPKNPALKKKSIAARSIQAGSVSSDWPKRPRSSGVANHRATRTARQKRYTNSICRARCALGQSRKQNVTRASRTTVIALARQMAFIAVSLAGRAVNPRLRQGAAQAAVWQVDDIDPSQRVEVGTDDVGKAVLEGRRWPGIEIGADGLAGQLVERR